MFHLINPDGLLALFVPMLIFKPAYGAEYHIIRRQMYTTFIMVVPMFLLNTFFMACFYIYVVDPISD